MIRCLLFVTLLLGCSASFWKFGPDYTKPNQRQRSSIQSQRKSGKRSLNTQKVVRNRLILEALRLLRKTSTRSDFGEQDLQNMLNQAIPTFNWTATQGLDDLVAKAKRRNAFETDGRPEPGDIVLFHNQWDENGNGQIDDWLTGCGVVVERRGPRFDAVVRTGNAPRRVTLWPDGPAVRVRNGKIVNDYMRVPSRSDPPDTVYLAGQLYAGHIDVDKL